MGWSRTPLDCGWQWRLLHNDMDYLMKTYLTPYPPAPRFVKVRLEEWKGHTKKSTWERELAKLETRNPFDPKPQEIRESVQPVIGDLTEWADSLVFSFMDLFVTSLTAFRLSGGRLVVGQLRCGWRCVQLNEEAEVSDGERGRKESVGVDLVRR